MTDDKLPGPRCPLVFLYPCLSSCTQFCIQSPSRHLPCVLYEELWCNGSREHTTLSHGEAYAHRPEDERLPVRELICPAPPPALPPLGSHTCKQQEQQCRSQAPSSSAAISESIFPFLSVKHPLKMTVHDVSLLSQLPYGT